MGTATLTSTVEQRVHAAINAVTVAGTHFAFNVKTCCRGCTDEQSDLGVPEGSKNYVWTFGGQDGELVFRSGQPYFREDEMSPEDLCECTEDEYDEDEDGETYRVYEGETCRYCYGEEQKREERAAGALYVYHGSVEAAAVAADAFRAQGFEVTWNGTDTESVVVNL